MGAHAASVMQKREVQVDWRKLEIDVEVFPRNAIASKPLSTSVIDYLWQAPDILDA